MSDKKDNEIKTPGLFWQVIMVSGSYVAFVVSGFILLIVIYIFIHLMTGGQIIDLVGIGKLHPLYISIAIPIVALISSYYGIRYGIKYVIKKRSPSQSDIKKTIVWFFIIFGIPTLLGSEIVSATITTILNLAIIKYFFDKYSSRQTVR